MGMILYHECPKCKNRYESKESNIACPNCGNIPALNSDLAEIEKFKQMLLTIKLNKDQKEKELKERKLRLAIGIIAGRVDITYEDIKLLGFDSRPANDLLTERAEEILFKAIMK